MAAPVCGLSESDVRRALDTVTDPELDEPITDLGFVRAVTVDGTRVVVHLRLPTSFCSPNFAYLMASDAKDAVSSLAEEVVIELDDHHDSDLINRGLAANAGYRGTFGHEAEQSLDELRLIFRRKAHTAAMERALTAHRRASPWLTEADLAGVTLGELADANTAAALRRRRLALGWSAADDAVVLVDAAGDPVERARAATAVRLARSVRISIDGNAHFCRGLLATRYPGSDADQAPRADGDGAHRRLLPVLTEERTNR